MKLVIDINTITIDSNNYKYYNNYSYYDSYKV